MRHGVLISNDASYHLTCRRSRIEAAAAKFLIDQHGEAAAIEAAMKADSMLDRGNRDGAAVWRRIVAAVNELQRKEPGSGERQH